MIYEAYITNDFYVDTYKGVAIDTSIFPRIALRASDEIDRLTINFVRLNGFANLTEEAQEAVMLATCAIAESYSRYEELTGGKGVIAISESTNGLSYTLDGNEVSKISSNKEAKAKAKSFLQMGGFHNGISMGPGLLKGVI